jgi:hypothetical protein
MQDKGVNQPFCLSSVSAFSFQIFEKGFEVDPWNS